MLAYTLITGDLFKINTVGAIYWEYLVLIVFTSGAAAMFIYYYGLKRVTASASTILELFWPFSAVILDYFINHNVLNLTQIIAALFLVLAFFKIVARETAPKFKFMAKVSRGSGRGAALGFPTINLDKPDLDINYGIYLVESRINGKIYRGLLHFGQKETFNEPASLELYIKETIPDIKNQVIEIREIKRLRDVKKFPDAEKLKEQMKLDLRELESVG
jgi:hypothetical protein